MAHNDEIQLKIKAPNQNYSDQAIQCNLSWTVLKLKEHLSVAYPGKPAVDEQKLIYSGRLLIDHLHLKDILRCEDPNIKVYTLHLVCSHQSRSHYAGGNKSSHTRHRSSSSSSEGSHSSDSMDDFADRWRSSHRSLAQSDASDDYSGSSGETSVRSTSPSIISATASNASNAEDSDHAPDIPQTYNYNSSQAQNNYTPNVSNGSAWTYMQSPPDLWPADFAARVAAYQQMCANYYATLYRFHSMSLENGVPVVQNTQSNAVLNNNQTAGATGAAQPVANARAAPAHVNAHDQNGNRDWLDYFYMWCRALVLFSIVYFYSSPERLLLVVGLGLLAFLYQEGWLFARLRNNRAAQNWANATHPQRAVNENENNDEALLLPHNENALMEEMDRQNDNEIEVVMDAEDPPHTPNPPATNNQNPAWTFITSFFSSLIPEPPAPVNLN